MWYLVYVVLWLALLFIFPWVVSCLSFLLWFLFNLSLFPVELLNFYIYPVWIIVYCAVCILYSYLIYEFVHHHLMNK
jgi:hypothetical protein